MKKNAIVVMFDSLQYSYLGCYGNEWIKTPNMDRFAKEGVLFENCYTEGLPTVPCRRAMHSGRYTLPVSGWVAATLEDTFIADLCWGQGIDTAIAFDCPMYRLPKFGYTRGFDTSMFVHGHEGDTAFFLDDPLFEGDPMDYFEESVLEGSRKVNGEKATQANLNEIVSYMRQTQYWSSPEDRYVSRTMKNAIRYLENVDRSHAFFLWVDSFDPHEPWNPPSVYMNFPCPYDPDYKGKHMYLPIQGLVEGVYTEAELHHIRMLYAELVTLCDQKFGELLAAIRRLGLEENTMVLMVSDHGEPLGNGEHGHGLMRKVRPWPYEELVHTPMILRFPGCEAGRRVKGFVQSVDVAPTVCDWLGIGVHPTHQGKSLLPLAKGEVDKIRDFAIAGYYGYSWSIITEEWSYIHWLRDDNNADDVFKTMYGDGVAATSSHLGQMRDECWRVSENDINDAQKSYKEDATVDGAAQWTCTPGSSVEVPEEDELYCRKSDPRQLNNVIAQHPDVARKLLLQLKDYMAELIES